MLPQALETLIEALGSLPGVGARTAERYAYFLLRADQRVTDSLLGAIDGIKQGVKTCPMTYALIDSSLDVSPLYSGPDRDKSVIAVVEEPFDIIALERTKQFNGTYHVLGGAMSPIDGIGPEELHIPELINRIKKDDVKEVILATNASVEGESTALYIQKHLEEQGAQTAISRLARGIPAGIDLEYADMITLTHALEGRRRL